MAFDAQTILRLIDAFRHKPELWDCRNANYFMKKVKREAWEDLASQFNVEVDVVKAKMTSLLSSFRREKQKMQRSLGSGKGTSEVYKSKWFAFQSLSFLIDKSVNGRTSLENEAGLENSEDVYSDFEEEECLGNCSGANCSAAVSDILYQNTENNSIFSRKDKRKRKEREEDLYPPEARVVLGAASVKDDCSTFAEHLTFKLRIFNRKKRSRIMYKIYSLLQEEEDDDKGMEDGEEALSKSHQ